MRVDLERKNAGATLKGYAWHASAFLAEVREAAPLSDLERGEAIHTLKGHTSWINAVAVTPDGKWAVSGSFDQTLMIWDVKSGEAIHTLKGHADQINAVAVTPDGKRAVSGSDDHTLKVWDLTSGNDVATFFAESAITSCAVLPGNRTFVAGDSSGRVHFLKLMNTHRA